MDRRLRNTGAESITPRGVRPWWTACVSLLGLVFLVPAIVWAAGPGTDLPLLAVTFPKSVRQGEALKIRIKFPNPPPAREFYRLEVDVDSHPVALADLSEESSTWITVPAQPAGDHTISIVWRNPPGGSSEVQTKTVEVLP
jgi:hypothetical protein